MSAWMLGDRHLATLAKYAVDNKLTDKSLADTAEMLWAANCTSMRSRYGDRFDDRPHAQQFDRGERHFKTDLQVERSALKSVLKQPMVIYKSASCLNYQACEDDGWPTSDANTLNEAIMAHARAAMNLAEEQVAADPRWSESNGWPLTSPKAHRERMRWSRGI